MQKVARTYVVESKESFCEFTLSDGTVLLGKVFPVIIHRTNEIDRDGNPVYAIEQISLLWTIKSLGKDLKEDKIIQTAPTSPTAQ